jgi:uncharacterized protein YjbI with pentapeptide repeats
VADVEQADARRTALCSSTMPEYCTGMSQPPKSTILRSANLRQSNLRRANLREADLEDADLVNAVLEGADLGAATLTNADLRHADLKGVRWKGLKSVTGANIYAVRNAPDGFVAWAMSHQAVADAGGDE